MQNVENENVKSELPTGKALTQDKEPGMQNTVAMRQENKIYVASRDYRIAVSKEQYETVKTAHKDSLNLLDSCGNALLQAMEAVVPPPESGRTVGEYTGQNLRQMAKSVCDIVNTKTNVVRSMYQISRDEM